MKQLINQPVPENTIQLTGFVHKYQAIGMLCKSKFSGIEKYILVPKDNTRVTFARADGYSHYSTFDTVEHALQYVTNPCNNLPAILTVFIFNSPVEMAAWLLE